MQKEELRNVDGTDALASLKLVEAAKASATRRAWVTL